jgi:hypothetical protein
VHIVVWAAVTVIPGVWLATDMVSVLDVAVAVVAHGAFEVSTQVTAALLGTVVLV